MNQSTRDGFTPLMAACSEGYLDVVRMLLDAGAEVHAANKMGSTPMSLARAGNHFDIEDLLDAHCRLS